MYLCPLFGVQIMERVTGIEPVSQPWEGCIIATIRYPQTRFIIMIVGLTANLFVH